MSRRAERRRDVLVATIVFPVAGSEFRLADPSGNLLRVEEDR